MAPLKLAVIGCGYWGPNLARTFAETPDASLEAVADRDPAQLAGVRRRHPHIAFLTEDYHDLFDLDLDAVVVSTPPETHFEIVRTCLEHDLDVFVEKPITTTADEALQLVELANARDRILMVGHIGAYNPSVGALQSMIAGDELGEIAYIDAVRGGLGLFHSSLNVVWDLAPHDISILMYLLGEAPVSVCARGVACIESSIEDVAYVTLTFPSGVLGHARLSWLDPCKTRRITVVGKRQMVVYDDLEAHEKLKVYDKRVDAIRRTDTFGDYQFAYHYGSVVSPYVHHEEPLRLECGHFVNCALHHEQPLTDGVNGLQVVEVIQAAQRSLREGGIEVPIVSRIGTARSLLPGTHFSNGRERDGALPDLRVVPLIDEEDEQVALLPGGPRPTSVSEA
jgi:predicted dehydrogenase